MKTKLEYMPNTADQDQAERFLRAVGRETLGSKLYRWMPRIYMAVTASGTLAGIYLGIRMMGGR